MKQRTRRPYVSLHDWLERTGTTQDRLAQLTGINRGQLSKILSRSRRCSYEKAIKLSEVTGVSVENLVRWMARDSRETNRSTV